MTELPYIRQPVDFSVPMRYAYGPDSARQPGVPEGAIEEYRWTHRRAYPEQWVLDLFWTALST